MLDIEKVKEWLDSEKAQESLAKAMKEVEEMRLEIEKASKIPWPLMHTPLCPHTYH